MDFKYTEEMCRSKLKEVGLDSPVHYMSNRSGCWFCMKASPEARIKAINRFPERIEKIKQYIKLSGRELYPDLTLEQIQKSANIKDLSSIKKE